MKVREPKTIIELLKIISRKDSLKMSYILSNIEMINKKYNLRISKNESKLLLEHKSMIIKDMRTPFDISAGMKPK